MRTAVYDDELRIEAHRFEGIVESFPNHFHAHYVIGFVESGAGDGLFGSKPLHESLQQIHWVGAGCVLGYLFGEGWEH